MTSFPTRVLRRLCIAGLALAVLLGGTAPAPSQAQPAAGVDSLAEGRGTAELANWPDVSLDQLLDEMGRRAPRLLPEIDSLELDYGYVAGDSTSDWSFELTWAPGDRVLNRGAVQPWSEAPPDTRMVSVELLADVVVDGQTVTRMIVAVDSMALRPAPDGYAFDVTVSHDRVFLNTSPEEARRYLESGITLDGLVVERMGFASFGSTPTGDARGRDREPRADPRRVPAPEPSIYEPRTTILIGWRMGPNPYYVAPRRPVPELDRNRRPRGENVGGSTDRGERVAREDATRRGAERSDASDENTRGEAPQGRTPTADRGERESNRGDSDRGEGERSGRSRGGDSGDSGDGDSSSGKSGSKDDDDDDEDPSLAVPALGAVAAVAFVAYAGGTVGLSGTGETPLGLTAGYTSEGGGVQLQASVNSAVIDQTDGQLLSVKALGFYDVFESRIQPAAGLGVQVDADGGRSARPAVSAGLVGNFGRFVLYGGFDVVQQTPELSVAYNFRYTPKENGDDAIAKR